MARYEMLILVSPAVTEDEKASLRKTLDASLQAGKGDVLSYDDWGKCRLAYPVNKHGYGIYFLARFDLDSVAVRPFIDDIQGIFKVRYANVVMRHILIQMDSKQSLDYKRPFSVDAAPTRDVDSFLRENKMGGLLNSPSAQDGHVATPTEAVEVVATKAGEEL